MFITELKIEEFRGIRKCESPIKLSKFTVLIGRNNVGKSAILEALYLFPHPKITDIIYDQYKIHVIRGLHNAQTINSLIYGYYGSARLEYIFDSKCLGISISSDGNIEVNVDDSTISSLSNLRETLKIEELENITFLIPNNFHFISRIYNVILREWDKIVKFGYHIKVAKVISRCVKEEITEILDGKRIRKVLPDGNIFYINLDDLGDGIRKVVKVMLLIESLNPNIILWDDFEIFAHPTLIKEILRWLAEGDWQVIISTHSINVLYELINLKDILSEDASILQLYKTKDDVLKYNVLTLEELEDLILANQDWLIY